MIVSNFGGTLHRVPQKKAMLSRISRPLLRRPIVGASRTFAADAGDVIGIDLGTTNSCVAM